MTNLISNTENNAKNAYSKQGKTINDNADFNINLINQMHNQNSDDSIGIRSHGSISPCSTRNNNKASQNNKIIVKKNQIEYANLNTNSNKEDEKIQTMNCSKSFNRLEKGQVNSNNLSRDSDKASFGSKITQQDSQSNQITLIIYCLKLFEYR